jgi:N-acetylmuramoyl-L-alanine amidase
MKKKIWIDSGHGGNDPGAVGNGMQEKDINLDVALRLGRLLSADFEINYSRTDDRAVSQRPQLANAWNADILISIHTNAFNQESANGTEILIFDNGSDRSKQSRNLASNIQMAFIKRIGTRDRGVKLDSQSQHSGGLGILRNSTMPAALFELAFVTAGSQFADVNALRNRRDEMAAAIAEGIYNYFGMKQNAIQTIPQAPIANGLTSISGMPVATSAQMAAYIRRINPNAPDIAELFILEGIIEGIRGDIAFAQSCIETGNFAFDRGTAVTLDQNNFCGMGVTNMGMKGNSYATPREGIKAQIQHLKAYANTEPLNNPLVSPTVGEPRFRFVQRGVAPYIEWLGAQENPQGKGWAMGAGYGEKILRILNAIIATGVTEVQAALDKLVRENVINSADYWIKNYHRVQHLDTLIINMANANKKAVEGSAISTVDQAITKLVSHRVINSPDYWLANYHRLDWLDTLMIKVANRL